jgi:hypothetical protein
MRLGLDKVMRLKALAPKRTAIQTAERFLQEP